MEETGPVRADRAKAHELMERKVAEDLEEEVVGEETGVEAGGLVGGGGDADFLDSSDWIIRYRR